MLYCCNFIMTLQSVGPRSYSWPSELNNSLAVTFKNGEGDGILPIFETPIYKKWHFQDPHTQKWHFQDPHYKRMTFIPPSLFLNGVALTLI